MIGVSFYIFNGRLSNDQGTDISENIMGQIHQISPSPTSSPKPKPLSSLEHPAPSPKNQPIKSENLKSRDLIGAVNSYRLENGRSRLSMSDAGCVFAEERLGELQTNYSHNGFDEVLTKTGKSGAAENIARTSKNKGASFVVNQMWAKSAGHNKNMLGDWAEGCGYYDGKYAVFIFLR